MKNNMDRFISIAGSQIQKTQKVFEGIVLGVDESFRLIVKNLADDQIVKLDSGEISTRISK